MTRFHECVMAGILLAIGTVRPAMADIIHFWNDAAGWSNTVKDYTFVDFTNFPNGTQITTQYDGFEITSLSFIHDNDGYIDGKGLWSPDGVNLIFDMPLHAVAVDHKGVVKFELRYNGEIVGISDHFVYAGSGTKFSGIISDVVFDEVYIFRPQPPFSSNVIALDNLYWAMPIPAPGALPVLAIGLLAVNRRRRV